MGRSKSTKRKQTEGPSLSKKFLSAVVALIGALSITTVSLVVTCHGPAEVVRVPHLVVVSGGFAVQTIPPSHLVEVRGTGFVSDEDVYVGVLGFPSLELVMVGHDGRFSVPSISPAGPGTYTYVALLPVWGEWVIAESYQIEVTGGQ